MTINAEIIGLVVGILTLGGAFISVIKIFVTMKEQIKTLFRKVDEIKAAKDEDVRELKESIRDLESQLSAFKDAYNEGNANIVNIINGNHIKLLEKITETH
tara:strand:- start:3526 stop:3828 length:303 start_codon:yes stop_codon:yes gene_type:complete